MQASTYLGDLGGLSAHRRLVLLDLRGTGGSAVPADPASYRCDRHVARLRRGEAWFPDAFAAFKRVWSGNDTAADWNAIAPFTYGRWDATAKAHHGKVASQKNQDAADVYYSDGAVDPAAARSALARLRVPVLLVAGEYDVPLPPKIAAKYAGLFPQAELTVQPGGGHFPWLDDPERFVRTLAGFLR